MSRSTWAARIGMILLATASTGALAAPARAATAGTATVDGTKVIYKTAKGTTSKVVVTRSGSTATIDDRVAVTQARSTTFW